MRAKEAMAIFMFVSCFFFMLLKDICGDDVLVLLFLIL